MKPKFQVGDIVQIKSQKELDKLSWMYDRYELDPYPDETPFDEKMTIKKVHANSYEDLPSLRMYTLDGPLKDYFEFELKEIKMFLKKELFELWY